MIAPIVKFYSPSHLRRIARDARRDVLAGGIFQPEHRIESRIGPKPEYDPDRFDNAVDEHHITDQARLIEARDDVRIAGDRAARTPSPWSVIPVIAFLFLVDAFAAVQVVGLVVQNPAERFIFGMALAGLVLVTTVFLRWSAASGNRAVFWSAIALYALLVFAIATIRADQMLGNEVSIWVALAFAILMVAVTVGPALLIDHLLGRVNPALDARRQLRHARRKLAVLQRQHDNAMGAVIRKTREPHEWQALHDRLFAKYQSVFNEYCAKYGTNKGGEIHEHPDDSANANRPVHPDWGRRSRHASGSRDPY